MPLKIIHQNHSEIIGRGMVILSSPPVAGLPQELQSGQLVEEAALLSKSHAIIARPTKAGIDPAIFHSVNSDFEQGIRRLLDDNDIKCILQVSCKEHQGLEVETTNLGPMPSETLQQVIARFAPNFDVKTVSTPNVKGSIVVAKDLPSAGSKLNEVQVISLKVGVDEMGFRRGAIVSRLADIVSLINGRLGYSENSSDTLN